MKIALCTDGIFPQAMGGMQRHSRLLAEHLARAGGVELVVLHPHAAGVFDPALGITEVPVAPIDTDKLYLRELWRYSGRVAKALDRIQPDVVLSQGFCVWKGGDRFSGRLIVHPHGLEMFQGLTRKERILGWPFRWALRRILRKSAACISLGGKLTGILQQQVRGTNCQVIVLPNAVDVPAAPAPQPAATTPLELLFVGRFAFNKGIDVLVAVAERLVKEGKGEVVRFSLAGDGPLLAQYQAKGLPANIRLLGRVDDAQLQQLYATCHAFILPTRFEGMPTVVLEAMAQGRPVFVSDVGATAELVGPHNGYLLPPGDGNALYNAILAFSERKPEVRAKMGRYSFERVQERFSWPAVTQGFLEVFRKLAKGT
ncbi:MAG TPA: glycosyltransferase family 4 protein [Flavobacteriales bacterium]|jgi:glycosyltransferase involved in cell wall biosynthesis|nr:glycosyltransferase family 4 protein [Flavobacteriales bacterium]